MPHADCTRAMKNQLPIHSIKFTPSPRLMRILLVQCEIPLVRGLERNHKICTQAIYEESITHSYTFTHLKSMIIRREYIPYARHHKPLLIRSRS